jgi:hypothetical protein
MDTGLRRPAENDKYRRRRGRYAATPDHDELVMNFSESLACGD